MKIVKFKNGKYGIRRGWFFGWFFQDLDDINYKHPMSCEFFEYCQGSERLVRKVFKQLKNKYKVIE